MAIQLLSLPTLVGGATTGYPGYINVVKNKINELATAMSISPLTLSAALGAGSPASDFNTMVAKVNELITALASGSAKAYVAVIGNSLDFGYGTTNYQNPAGYPPGTAPSSTAWPSVISLNSSQFRLPVDNRAVSGKTVGQFRSEQLASALAAWKASGLPLLVLLVGGAENDIVQGVSQSQTLADYQGIANDAAAYATQNGLTSPRLVMLSTLPSTRDFSALSSSYPTPATYAARQKSLNNDVRTKYGTYGYGYYVNQNATPALYDPNNDTYYFTDHQHLLDAGQAARAGAILPYLNAAYSATMLAPAADPAPASGGNPTMPAASRNETDTVDSSGHYLLKELAVTVAGSSVQTGLGIVTLAPNPASSTNYGNVGASSYHTTLGTNGRVAMMRLDADCLNASICLRPGGTGGLADASYGLYFFNNGGALNVATVANGSTLAQVVNSKTTRFTANIGDFVAVFVDGSTREVVAQLLTPSGQWTDKYVFDTLVTTDLFISIDLNGGSPTKLAYLQGAGLS